MALLLIPAVLLVMAIMGFEAGAGQLADTALRFLGLMLSYAAYLAIFIFLTLAVSAWAPSSRSALLILLVIWITNTMVAPRAVADLVRASIPTPSQFELQTAMAADHVQGVEQLLRDEFNAERWDDIPPERMGAALLALERPDNRVLDLNIGRLWNTLDRQGAVQQGAGFLLPLLAIQSASAAFAGTDDVHYRAFSASAERYRREFEHVLNTDFDTQAGDQGLNYAAGPELWRQIKRFPYQAPSFAMVLRSTWIDLAALGLGFIFTFGLAIAAMRKLRS